MNNYFITGLPRSRTAWLANFMCSGDSFCFHEGLRGCKTPEDFEAKLNTGHCFTGNSDSGQMFMRTLMSRPDAPVLIVERDIHEVIDSLADIGLYNGDVRLLLVEMSRQMHRIKGMRVKFDEIPGALEDIWTYLVDLPFDKQRAEQLNTLNVQTTDYSGDDFSLGLLLGAA